MNQIFRGRRFEVKWVRLPDDAQRGLTDWDGRSMIIKKAPEDVDDDERDTLSTLIHEGLHACLWDLSEDAVDETATDLAKFLWRIGYRKRGES